MEHTLPKLDYDYGALSPHISEETMTLHHSKHHQTYVDKLNGLIKGTKFENASLDEIVMKCPDGPMFNNAGQHWNHTLFWQLLGPNGGEGGEPPAKLSGAINASFDSFDNFKTKFEECGVNTFGSGWAWLAQDDSGKLELMSCSNADNPLRHSKTALFGVDVWEHSYYVDYRNRRPDYLKAIWNVVNWEKVASLLK